MTPGGLGLGSQPRAAAPSPLTLTELIVRRAAAAPAQARLPIGPRGLGWPARGPRGPRMRADVARKEDEEGRRRIHENPGALRHCCVVRSLCIPQAPRA